MAVIAPPRRPDSHDAEFTVEPDRGGETFVEAFNRVLHLTGFDDRLRRESWAQREMVAFEPPEYAVCTSGEDESFPDPFDMWTEQPGIGRLGVGFLPILPNGVPECA
ncbi:hypothetical protein [Agromyces mariniharenae]|uniref:Uncharacterized protein n=1 Tax=Agromyces mariniharenae TaxID=2604423 RepID=A0A5S4V0P9_9MICO|nr:hypothetical protein [Agromyces mariniharenae]TYL52687.1 hypothetical protein FYC51_02755 [Agromyces mariniharenae]